MDYLTIVFYLLTLPVSLIGTIYFTDLPPKGNVGVSLFATLVLFVAPLWAVYFFIQWLIN